MTDTNGKADDANSGVIDAIVDPTSKPKPQAEDAAAKVETKPQADQQPPPETPEERAAKLAEENAYLKTKMGEQSTQVGELRKRVGELEPLAEAMKTATGAKREQAKTHFDEAVEKLNSTFGEELAKPMLDAMMALVYPIRAEKQLADLVAKHPDLPQMEERIKAVLDENPSLKAAAANDLSVISVIYRSLKAEDFEKQMAGERQKGAAEQELKDKEKLAAFVERPGAGGSKEPQEVTLEDKKMAWVEQIAQSKTVRGIS